ncbi:MAG: hypothetical protein AAF927_11615 [Bacteroidota bacterium]
MSDRYSELFEKVCRETEYEVEDILDRRLTRAEKVQMRKTCSIRMLETLLDDLKHAPSPADAEASVRQWRQYDRVFDHHIDDLVENADKHLSLELSNSQIHMLRTRGTGKDVLYLQELVKEGTKDGLIGKIRKMQAKKDIEEYLEGL